MNLEHVPGRRPSAEVGERIGSRDARMVHRIKWAVYKTLHQCVSKNGPQWTRSLQWTAEGCLFTGDGKEFTDLSPSTAYRITA